LRNPRTSSALKVGKSFNSKFIIGDGTGEVPLEGPLEPDGVPVGVVPEGETGADVFLELQLGGLAASDEVADLGVVEDHDGVAFGAVVNATAGVETTVVGVTVAGGGVALGAVEDHEGFGAVEEEEGVYVDVGLGVEDQEGLIAEEEEEEETLEDNGKEAVAARDCQVGVFGVYDDTADFVGVLRVAAPVAGVYVVRGLISVPLESLGDTGALPPCFFNSSISRDFCVSRLPKSSVRSSNSFLRPTNSS